MHKLPHNAILIGLSASCLLLFLMQFHVAAVVMLVITILFLVVLIWGSANIRSGVFLKAMSQLPNTNQLAITFDDGPSELTNKFLDLLKAHNVLATFFLIGKHLEQFPDVVKRMSNEGHTIGNHSFSHANTFALKSKKEIKADLLKCNQAIHKHTGMTPTYFRPPFGVTAPAIGKAAAELNLTTVGWSIRTYDGVKRSSAEILNNIEKKSLHGTIILFHDSNLETLDALETVILKAKKLGMEIVSLPKE